MLGSVNRVSSGFRRQKSSGRSLCAMLESAEKRGYIQVVCVQKYLKMVSQGKMDINNSVTGAQGCMSSSVCP